MASQTVPEELLALREEIDAIDDELLRCLVRRFRVTEQVGRLKAQNRLDSVDPQREQQKLERLGRMAEEESLDRDFVLALFQGIFDEVVRNHRRHLSDA